MRNLRYTYFTSHLVRKKQFRKRNSLTPKKYLPMLQLQSLQIQLENLKVIFQEALIAGKPGKEVQKLMDQIEALEKAIEERKAYLEKRQNLN